MEQKARLNLLMLLLAVLLTCTITFLVIYYIDKVCVVVLGGALLFVAAHGTYHLVKLIVEIYVGVVGLLKEALVYLYRRLTKTKL
jgi:hypothetical protein